MFRTRMRAAIGHISLALREPEAFAQNWHTTEATYHWSVFAALVATAIAGTTIYGLTMGLLESPARMLMCALACTVAAGIGWGLPLPALYILNSASGSNLRASTMLLAALVTTSWGGLAMIASVPISIFFSAAIPVPWFVLLVHLTGEEFPGDCLGARALAQALVEGALRFTGEDGRPRDVSGVQVVGVHVLDMIGHNSDRDRDVFQIAPGEGCASARLARRAHLANLRWNRLAAELNRAEDRKDAGRAPRMKDTPSHPAPPLFSHLALRGEVRVEWEPRSALFNTDGQIFSDVGVPVVLFMENYDINRKGYHDTHDTMENIDLDYCAALTAIAIETVADTACSPEI